MNTIETCQETKLKVVPAYYIYDGEEFINFYLLDVDTEKMVVKLAIENRGNIFETEHNLFIDKKELCLCFEIVLQYGIYYAKVKLQDFE